MPSPEITTIGPNIICNVIAEGNYLTPMRKPAKLTPKMILISDMQENLNQEIRSNDLGKKSDEGDNNVADLINKCKSCNKVVINEDNAVYCDLCQFWCHAKCEKLSVEEYDGLTKQKFKIKWYCCQCKTEAHKPENIIDKEARNIQMITWNMPTRTGEQLPTDEKNCL